jgi:enoyl-CoA hydratase/carnithine racemase
MAATVEYEVRDRVAEITLSRPEALNVYSVAMKDELVAALGRAEADDEVVAIIITGSGKAFCAGMDLSPGPGTFARLDEDEQERLRDSGGELTLRLYDCTKPVIGAINGVAVGVGATMTLAFDVRLAARGASFGFVFARRGIVLESCSSWFLPRIVGMPTAIDWSLTGRIIDAEEAHRSGLVLAVHEPDELMAAARRYAQQIVEHCAPVSVSLNRQLLWRMAAADHPMAANIAESRAMHSRGLSADSHEGVASFLERRPARFDLTVPRDLPEVFDDVERVFTP